MHGDVGMGIHQVGQVAVPVKDLGRAITFYRDVLGLSFLFQAPPALAFFDCGGVRIMLDTPEPEFSHPSSILYFKVADIHKAHADLMAKGVSFRDTTQIIAKMPDHDLWMTFFRDGEGNTMALMSEARPPSAPPA
jgi:methylmalonyl-CoA/ethylmalonyl-CoA epimerase